MTTISTYVCFIEIFAERDLVGFHYVDLMRYQHLFTDWDFPVDYYPLKIDSNTKNNYE